MNEIYYPLSHPQKRIWYTEAIYADKGICNLRFLVRMPSEMNYLLLNRAINRMISENDSFGIRLKENKHQEPEQYFVKHQERKFDFFDFSAEEDSTRLDQWFDQKRNEKFTLFDSDLYDFSIIKASENECIVYGEAHHIMIDGISIEKCLNQISCFYYSFLNGEDFIINSKNSYVQFLENEQAYLKSNRFEKDEQFWLEEFETVPSVTGLKEYNPYLVSTKASRETFTLPESLMKKIDGFSKEHDFSIFTLFVSALSLSMYQWMSSPDIVLEMSYGNRTNKQEKELMGMMVSTVPLRISMDPNEEVLTFIRRISRKQRKILRHQKYPFNLLSKHISQKNGGSNRLCGISIDYREMDNSDVTWISPNEEPNDFAIHLERLTTSGILRVHVDYRNELFTKEEMNRFFTSMLNQLLNTVEGPSRKVKEIEILSEEEKEKILVGFNHTQVDFPSDKTIHEFFEQQVARDPEAIAVVYQDQKLTYQELNEKANQLAHYLQKKGVKPETLVGICVDRSLEMIIGLLGILKAGGAYVPLDPTYPDQRLQYIVDDAGIQLLVTQERLQEKKELFRNIESICLDRDYDEITQEDVTLPFSGALANSLAYVIYTSGSTGNPKGVMVEHRQYVNVALGWRKEFALDRIPVRLLQMASFSFDVFAGDVAKALLNGGELILCPEEIRFDPTKLYQLCRENRITILDLTPAMAAPFMDYIYENQFSLPDLELFILGSDSCSVEEYKKLLSRFGNQFRIVNCYGVTEASIDTSYFEASRDLLPDAGHVPIGKPLPNMQMYIVNQQLQLQPIGVAGELCIGGSSVARGYYNRRELTAEKFVDNPFMLGERLYRTGDLARWLPDGTVEFLGRMDHQVKIRGYRIELGEVESGLVQTPPIKEAVVMARDVSGNQSELCAYIVSEESWSKDSLRDQLSSLLPSYMIPTHFVQLDQIPLTPNGKVDRKNLPAPKGVSKDVPFEAPETEMEKTLATIWKDILDVEKVGRLDNFFDLGGDSIKAIQVSARLHAVKLKLEMKYLLGAPQLAEAALRMVRTEKQNSQSKVEGTIPLTPIQKWFFSQSFVDSSHWNQSMMLYSRDGFDEQKTSQVWTSLVEHHDVLRSTFLKEAEGMVGFIQEGLETTTPLFNMTVFDLTNDKNPKMKMDHGVNDLQAGFNLEEGPLVHLALFRTIEGDHLYMIIHHLVVDGVSWRILLEDFATGYMQLTEGKKIELQPKTSSYQMWANGLQKYARSERIKKESLYWEKIQMTESVELPKCRKVPDRMTQDLNHIMVTLQEEDTLHLVKKAHQAHQTELNDLLLTALALTLQSWTGQSNVLIELEGHGREPVVKDLDISRTVGWFTTTYPVLLHVPGSNKLGETIINVKETLRNVPHKGIGFGILKYLAPEVAELPFTKQPEVIFNYLGEFDKQMGEWEMSSFSSENRDIGPRNHELFPLSINGIRVGNQMNFYWSFHPEEFAVETIQEIANQFVQHLKQIVQYCTSVEETEKTPSDYGYTGMSVDRFRQLRQKIQLKLK
ncbi:non-ribosomal peptide synthetase [Baia soyae]|uniref:Non-ribosomal peptide synthase protein (TIGR01720 family)/amino acid adenylation domain-containing protein n=1 Tax=Baia soyae TaxID=1544746 RepID=A0A4R2S024_9BACL|nr:non-ribosomal peptide synthetase [Baia soyae]TCP69306.1 non-ribosomal peptide synthase protein (TIGR01720 family)/amino acid adenylation domain-containing protein [Baia soyae]